MTLRILYEEPPLFAEIDAAFHVRGKPVIFCWGETIFNPQRVPLSRELGVHEAVHSARQGDTEATIRAWWLKYIDDTEFRFREELPAHIAEYQAFCKFHMGGEKRGQALHLISNRLASPLYGNIISWAEAKRRIREAA